MKKYTKYILVFLLIFICVSSKLSAQKIQPIRIIYVEAKNKLICLSTFLLADSNISDWRLSSNGIDTPLSKLALIVGSVVNCKSYSNVILQGLPMNQNVGSLSLHIPNLPVDSHSLHDFVQWGDSGQAFEADAANKKLWREGRFVKDKLPISFKCTFGDHDDTCWQGVKQPIIILRFAYVSPLTNSVCIKNAGVSNVDLSLSALCINGNCYDTIKNIPMNILKGKLNIQKNDSVVIQFVNDSIKNSGSIGLFVFPKIYNDTSVMLDFVQWGDSMQPYSSLAGQKGIWDSLQTVHFNRNDSIVYTGNFSFAQSGASYWQNRHLNGLYIDEALANYISVYPNPASQNLNIQSNLSGNIYYTINDATGRVLKNGMFNNNQQIDITNFALGVYYIKLSKDNGKPGFVRFVKSN